MEWPMPRDLLRNYDTRSARPALVKRRNDIFCPLAGNTLFQEESDARQRLLIDLIFSSVIGYRGSGLLLPV
ncbi:hypothetical protein [Methanoregula sp.]|uniref:hypothetical protein n=1 Tax=Methanoregula sp. TaxID=2052170 RepID=UPI003BAED2A4